jgi:hypothetical protein
MLGYPILLADERKSPGFIGQDWYSHEWSDEEILKWAQTKSNVTLGIKLFPLIDIEIDAESEDELILARQEVQALLGPISTVSWTSRRGEHYLLRLTEPQQQVLLRLECPAVLKIGRLEFRIGAGKSAQSLIPPSRTDEFDREWIVPLGESEPFDVPANVFDVIVSNIKPKHVSLPEFEPSDRPGDIFNERASWDDVLKPFGWTSNSTAESVVRHWTRPGKTEGVSATTGYCQTESRADCLYVFSTASEVAPLEPNQSYSKFEAYTALNHDGDYSAASSALVEQGYVAEHDGSEFSVVTYQFDKKKRTDEVLPDSAFDNLMGEFVLANDHNTEAFRDAVLMQAWELFGCYIGKDVTFNFNATKVFTNGFLVVLGKTGTSRKGTSYNVAISPYRYGDGDLPEFANHRVITGVGSGEALIQKVADKTGAVTDGRALLYQQEFRRLLTVIRRTDSTMSPILREAYDGGTLSNETKGLSLIATGAHVSIIAHTTFEEFRTDVQPVDFSNGLLNRALFLPIPESVCKIVVSPDDIPEGPMKRLQERLHEAREWGYNASAGRVLRWSTGARSLWNDVYYAIRKAESTSTDSENALDARVSNQILKLSMRFAAFDMCENIERYHLQSAIDIVQHYQRQVKKLIWEQSEEESDREKLQDYIHDKGPVTRTDIHAFFKNHKTSREIQNSLDKLVESNHIVKGRMKKGRRTVDVWASKQGAINNE